MLANIIRCAILLFIYSFPLLAMGCFHSSTEVSLNVVSSESNSPIQTGYVLIENWEQALLPGQNRSSATIVPIKNGQVKFSSSASTSDGSSEVLQFVVHGKEFRSITHSGSEQFSDIDGDTLRLSRADSYRVKLAEVAQKTAWATNENFEASKTIRKAFNEYLLEDYMMYRQHKGSDPDLKEGILTAMQDVWWAPAENHYSIKKSYRNGGYYRNFVDYIEKSTGESTTNFPGAMKDVPSDKSRVLCTTAKYSIVRGTSSYELRDPNENKVVTRNQPMDCIHEDYVLTYDYRGTVGLMQNNGDEILQPQFLDIVDIDTNNSPRANVIKKGDTTWINL